MAQYKRILVPVDGSPFSEQALPHALRAAEADSLIVLFFVGDLVADHYLEQGSDKEALWERQLAPHREYLRGLEAALSERGWKVESAIGTGNPADVIVDYAKEEGVDLIVLSSHGRSGWRKMVLGSVASRVIQSSLCPVLVVRPH